MRKPPVPASLVAMGTRAASLTSDGHPEAIPIADHRVQAVHVEGRNEDADDDECDVVPWLGEPMRRYEQRSPGYPRWNVILGDDAGCDQQDDDGHRYDPVLFCHRAWTTVGYGVQ